MYIYVYIYIFFTVSHKGLKFPSQRYTGDLQGRWREWGAKSPQGKMRPSARTPPFLNWLPPRMTTTPHALVVETPGRVLPSPRPLSKSCSHLLGQMHPQLVERANPHLASRHLPSSSLGWETSHPLQKPARPQTQPLLKLCVITKLLRTLLKVIPLPPLLLMTLLPMKKREPPRWPLTYQGRGRKLHQTLEVKTTCKKHVNRRLVKDKTLLKFSNLWWFTLETPVGGLLLCISVHWKNRTDWIMQCASVLGTHFA